MREYKFELWVIIFLQLVMLETTVEKPNLLPVLLAFGGFIFMRKVMDWDAKGESDGDEYGEHHDHLPDAAGTVHTGRRA